MPATTSTARLEARITTDLHSMLKRAAELQGRTMTDFVVSAVQDAAQRAIEQAEVIRLSFVTDRHLGATDVRHIGASCRGSKRTFRGVYTRVDFAAF